MLRRGWSAWRVLRTLISPDPDGPRGTSLRLTAHGGVNEIGGNKVLLEAGGGALWLDFGLSFGAMKDFYCEFCQPRSWAYVGDQVALGLLPDLAGVYRDDLLSRTGRAEPGPPGQQGAFFSHAHMDHV